MNKMKLIIQTLVTLLIAVTSLPSSATIYKCIDDSGEVSMQELPCPSASIGSELVIRGSNNSLSPEDQAWVADRKSMLHSICIREFATYEIKQVVSPEVSKQICECGVNRYFSNPVSKLRALEDSRDVEGNKKLFRPAMTACAKEIIDKQP